MNDREGSERIRALEAALAERDRELERLRRRVGRLDGLGAWPDPTLAVDDGGTVRACNVRACAWLDRPEEHVVGAALIELFDEGSREAVALLQRGRWAWAGERLLRLGSGRWVDLAACPGEGGAFLTLHDGSTRRILEEAAERRQRMEALADLSGAVARELNDPMSIVQGRLELLLELGSVSAESTERHLKVALDHARRISATLRNLRLVGRSGAPHLDRVTLSQVVDDALSLLGPRQDRVVVEITPPDLAAGGDAAMYARVLSNLLRQAFEGAARADVRLRARATRSHVVVRVGTPGGGRREPLDSWFGSELSIDETLLASVGGTMEGWRTGGSPRFELRLPRAPIERMKPRPVRERMLVVGGKGFAEHVEAALQKDGFAFDWARRGAQALEALVARPYDAVVAELFLDETVSGLSLACRVASTLPHLQDRVVLVVDERLGELPVPVATVGWPVRRVDLLEALGRRVRRS